MTILALEGPVYKGFVMIVNYLTTGYKDILHVVDT